LRSKGNESKVAEDRRMMTRIFNDIKDKIKETYKIAQ
jgi:hypothetical protein